jgi:PAS domain S-box-containing protein
MDIWLRSAPAAKALSMATVSEFILEQIRDNGEFTLYRARQRGSDMPLLVVAPTAEQPLPQSLRRLEHEYSLAAELDPAWAAKPIALTRHEGRTILVIEDPGGEPLDRILERDRRRPLDLARILSLAINLATALGHAHQRGLIHKDVKPENVFVALEPSGDVGHIWLTGFGITSRLPRERQAPAPPEFIAGTLAYMSPEQTGRMNRSIDTRSDLYSLGVTLYQMLTGVLPFAAADPLEWVHCHIARQPVAPVLAVTQTDRREVPEALSAIVMRLLAKNAEDRYQTAAGLTADLRRCLSEWRSNGRIDLFPLGADDVSDRLLIPEKLYGREREVDTLLVAFDRVVTGGRPELVLVSGYSGVGKSAVVHELHKSLVPSRGLFASGKFDQYKRDIPYATIAQAFQSLIRTLLSKPEAELSKWRDDLVQALSPNGSLVADLVPELKLIIGEQPPVAPLPPQEAKTRSHLAFRRFLGVFARPEHPLALFLDDLQWLDAATLDLLEDLLVQEDLAHLLVVGAYRDNEVDPAHPLMRRLSAIREAGATVHEIRLAPLASGDLVHLVADIFHCDSQPAASLAQLLREKTAGNPFFAVQFIHALVEEGLITFEHAATRWRWDLDAIRIKGYTDNVVDLMVAKLNRLPATTQKALQQLACVGSSAEIPILAAVLEKSEQETEAALWEALQLELIVRSEDSYQFAHDRIQEAAYSLIAEEARAEAHLRIGRLLHAHTPPEKREEAIFEIVNQLNRGAELISSEDERFQVAELNVIAGKRAKASTAHASALKYFIAGEALLTDDPWERRHDLIFQLELYRAECEFLTGEPAIAAERMEMLRMRASGAVELAMATCVGIDVYMTLGQMDRAIAICLDYLRRIGIDWPLHPTEEQVKGEYQRIWSQLGSREIEEVVDSPLMNDPISIATLDVLTKASAPALFTDTNLSALVICRAVSLSIEHGNNDSSCLIYVYISDIAGHRLGDYKNAFRFAQLGYDLVEKRGLKRVQAATYHTFAAMIMPWMKHPLVCSGLTRQAFEIANTIGDLTCAVLARMGLIGLLIAAGDPLVAVQSEAESGFNFAHGAKFAFGFDTISMLLGFIRTLRGLTTDFGSFDYAEFDEIEFERKLNSHPPLAHFWYWVRKLQTHFFVGDFASAIEASSKARPLRWSSPTFEIAEYEFYSALSRAALWDSVASDQRQEHFEALAAHYKPLQVWAEHCPENFEDRAALVGAEIARIEGRVLDAIELYEQAIRSASANGFVHNEGIAHEVAARFYAARGFETFADAYLRNARNCYARWGADGKVRRLEARYPRLRAQPASSSLTAAPAVTIDAPLAQFDAETVVKASQTLSSEINLSRLIEKLMRLAVEHAGAERGLLILVDNDGPRIEAEARAGPGSVEVSARRERVRPIDLPQSVLQYVLRTHERVLVDDAATQQSESEDEYIRSKHPRSVLCLPILKQTKMVGLLYLENNLTAHAFTSSRVAVLDVLASQAAISLENARLYSGLQRSEAFLAQGQKISQTGSFGWNVTSGEIHWSEESYNILEYDPASRAAFDLAFRRVHPDDRGFVQEALAHATREKTDLDFEVRFMMADGRVKHAHIMGRALQSSSGDLEFVGAMTDITAAKKAEEKIRQSEKEARQLIDLSPLHITELAPDGVRLYTNRASLDYFGITLEEWQNAPFQQLAHPQDADMVEKDLPGKIQRGLPFEYDARLKRKDSQYRWFHYRFGPMSDEEGRITRWYAAGTDIDDRKLAEQRLQEENVALREEVDKASMFEEIVGISAPLKKVLSRISKVAPTGSSVLITGETGTGKELVARAIHRRSPRSSHTFVSVNCAVIPRDLIASELFGHEKGAFTGATQRRLGRFELAAGGTLFLDEVGELPAETQVALLRVLQEHEFERIGGSGSIRADVRVIAATNRDLEAAIESGKFRSDLFYRLNVFPIEVPTLRERKEDIPLLLEYFLDRYGRKAGKRFRSVDRRSLDLLQSYPWPGNIRELQNVVERSVIVSDIEVFSVDESWLSRRPATAQPAVHRDLFRTPPAEEKSMIEAALRDCGGRVYGPDGAAEKLGIPRSTLESKIRVLKINKNRFKGPPQTS